MAKKGDVKKKVTLELDANTVALLGGFRDVRRSISKMAKDQKKHNDMMAGGWRKVADAVQGVNAAIELGSAAVSAMAGVYSYLTEGIAESAREVEVMSDALAGHDIDLSQNAKSVRDLTDAYISGTTIMASEFRENLQQISHFSTGAEASLEQLTRASRLALDIQASLGESDLGIAKAVGETLGGDIAALVSDIPGLRDELEALEAAGGSADDVMDLLADKFGGAADSADSLLVSLTSVRSDLDDLTTAFSQMVASAARGALASTTVADSIRDMRSDILDADTALGGFVRETVAWAIEAFGSLAAAGVRVAGGIRQTYAAALAAQVWLQRQLMESRQEEYRGQIELHQQYADEYMEQARNSEAALGYLYETSQIGAAARMEQRMMAQTEMAQHQQDLADAARGQTDAAEQNLRALEAEQDRGLAAMDRTQQAIDTLANAAIGASEAAAEAVIAFDGTGAQGGGDRGSSDGLTDAIASTGDAAETSAAQVGYLSGVIADFAALAEAGGAKVFVDDTVGDKTPWADMAKDDSLDIGAAIGASFGAGLEDGVGSALDSTGAAIQAWATGAEGAMSSLGDSMKSILADTFGSIGSALMQSIPSAIGASAGLGPIGALLGIGAALLAASGLLGGTGSGQSSAVSATRTVDVFSTIRSESDSGGSTVNYNVQTGAIFADPGSDDTASRAVVRGIQRARSMGELPVMP